MQKKCFFTALVIICGCKSRVLLLSFYVSLVRFKNKVCPWQDLFMYRPMLKVAEEAPRILSW